MATESKEEASARRGRGSGWPKGTSGNPGGMSEATKLRRRVIDEQPPMRVGKILDKLFAMATSENGDNVAARTYLEVVGVLGKESKAAPDLSTATPEVLDWLESLN